MSTVVMGAALDASAADIATTNWWPGNGSADDVAGAQPGTLVNGAGFAAGKVDQAFRFDGTDDRVNFGNVAGNVGTANFTLAFWIKTSASGRHEAIVSKRSVCGHGSFLDVRTDPLGRVYVELDGSAGGSNYNFLRANPVVNDGTFHHVALVRKGTTASLHVDGKVEKVNSTTGSTNIDNAANLIAGKSACTGVDGTAHFSGLLDELVIGPDGDGDGRPNVVDNCPAAANGVQEDGDRDGLGDLCDPDGPGVVPITRWWPSNGDPSDAVGVEHGTVVGAGYVTGKVGQAFNFDGENDYVNFGSKAGNVQTGDFSLAFWIKTSSSGRPEAIIGKRPSCNYASMLELRLTSFGKVEAELGSAHGVNYKHLVSSTSINDAAFHHVALVRKGTIVRLYVDGVKSAEGSTTSPAHVNNEADLIAGKSPCIGVDGTAHFTGALDEIVIGPDSDGDGHPDTVDTCPADYGPQDDTDGDGLGDLCEPPVVLPDNPAFIPEVSSDCFPGATSFVAIQPCVYQLMPTFAVTNAEMTICETQNGLEKWCQRFFFSAPTSGPPVVNDDDPSEPPEGGGWEWSGAPGSQPGDANGAWHRPATGDSMHPDYGTHPPPPTHKGDHWDWIDKLGKAWERPKGGRVWYPKGEEWWKFVNYLGL